MTLVSGCPFTSVQDARDAANPGDTIRIRAGVFGRITIHKDIALIGAGAGIASLNGGDPGGKVVAVEAGVIANTFGDHGGGAFIWTGCDS